MSARNRDKAHVMGLTSAGIGEFVTNKVIDVVDIDAPF